MGVDKKFNDETIKHHNFYRSRHNVPSLKYNKDIASTAQKWADHMASKNIFQHSSDSDRKYKGESMGENIAMKWTSTGEEFTGVAVTNQWYTEVERYSYSRDGGPRTGHFTQIVWKDSREFGIGKAQTKDGKWLVVANYHPAGNIIGHNRENVFPPKDGKTSVEGGDASSSSSSGGGGLKSLFNRDKKDDTPTKSAHVTHTPEYVRTYTSPSSTTSTQSRTVSREVKEERGPGGYKTIVTETVVDPDGTKRTTTTVRTGEGGATGGSDLLNNFEDRRQNMLQRFNQMNIDMNMNMNSNNNKSNNNFHCNSNDSNSMTEEFDSKFKSMGLDDGWKSEKKTYYTSSDDKDKKEKDKKEKEKKPQKLKDFIDDCVKSHNKYRKKHGKVGDLKHNKELDVLAQRWADHLAATSVLKHSNDTYKGEPLGENVATKWSSVGADYNGTDVVEQWYSEVEKYDYGLSQFKSGTGHFSQVVWKDSKEIGVGKSFGRDGRVFVVCNYNPAGNVVGKFRDNVFPASK